MSPRLHAQTRRPRLGLATLLAFALALAPGIAAGLDLATGFGLGAGFAPELALAQDAPAGGAAIAAGGESVLLRAEPSYDAPVLTPLAAGTPVDLLADPTPGPNGTTWLRIAAAGQTGYVPAAAVTDAAAPTDPPPAAPDGSQDDPTPQADPDPQPNTDPTPIPADGVPAADVPAETDPDPDPDPTPTPTDTAPATAPATETPPPAVAPGTGAAATTTAETPLRRGPDAADAPLLVLPPGAPVTVVGPAAAGFLPVTADGAFGWVDAASLAPDPDPADPVAADDPDAADAAEGADAPEDGDLPGTDPTPDAAPAPDGSSPATTTVAVNLRAAPAQTAPVLRVLPAGAPLETVGAPQNGYYPVAYDGQTGWAAAPFLALADGPSPTAPDAAPAPDATPVPDAAAPSSLPVIAPAPAADTPPAASSGIAWPMAGGTWTVIQGYNNGTHTNRGPRSDYRYSLDLALADGDTAGQPVAAPVSGTIRWVDPGSGGILIDAGTGYGVALFHVTVAGGLGSGQSVAQGQPLGVVSGPGGPGYAGTPHVDLTLWQLTDGANLSTPFTGPNAIAGQDFPADGSPNQHMSTKITP